jgi:23S rRNA A2030 N6-methylase RlmJ
LLVIAGFAAIGFELRNEKIRTLFLSYGNPKIYQSLRISFNLLPSFMQQMNSPKMLILHPVNSLKQMLTNAEYMLDHLIKNKTRDIN